MGEHGRDGQTEKPRGAPGQVGGGEGHGRDGELQFSLVLSCCQWKGGVGMERRGADPPLLIGGLREAGWRFVTCWRWPGGCCCPNLTLHQCPQALVRQTSRTNW